MQSRTTSLLSLTRRAAQLGAVAALGLLVLSACSKGGGAGAVGAEDMTMGSESAKVTLVEYASVTCTHCATFNETVFPQIEEKYIKPGKVKYVYKEYLTPPYDVSAAGVLIARCAGKDNYFKVIDSVMRSQREMFADGTTNNARPVLQRIAASAGLNQDQFEACVKDPQAMKRVKDNWDKYLKDDGINGTPAFFINGKKFEYKGGGLAEFDAAFAAAGAK